MDEDFTSLMRFLMKSKEYWPLQAVFSSFNPKLAFIEIKRTSVL